jgi:hypothetical protein
MMIPREDAPAGTGPAPTPPAHYYPGKRERRCKPRISATRRWQLISEKTNERLQQRGFVGGDALEDLSEAALELDAKYATDIHGLLALTEPDALVEEFRNLFAGYGLGEQSLARLVGENRATLEALAGTNAGLADDRTGRVARGAPLLAQAVARAIGTLTTFIREEPLDEPAPMIAERQNRALRKAIKQLRALEGTVAGLAGAGSAGREQPASDSPLAAIVRNSVVKAYEGCSAAALAEAPVAALKGISPHSAHLLETSLAMHTIRDMTDSVPVKMAKAVVALANAGSANARPLAAVAAEPVDRLEGLSGEQAGVLQDVLQIRTVRDLAENRYFLTAGAIVMLADLEN